MRTFLELRTPRGPILLAIAYAEETRTLHVWAWGSRHWAIGIEPRGASRRFGKAGW